MRDRGVLWDIFEAHTGRLKRSGPDNAVGRCPFHDDKHPSFAFNLRTGQWVCYSASCGLAGSYKRFLELVGKSPEEIEGLIEPVQESIKKQEDLDFLAWKLRFRESDPFMGEYVLPESILGIFDYMPTGLIADGFKGKTLREFGIGYDLKADRVIYPIRDLYGNLVGVSGRTTRSEKPKYKVYLGGYNKRGQWVPGDFGEGFDEVFHGYHVSTKNYLWNAHNVFPNLYVYDNDEPIIVVEGYKACMWTVQCGFENTVALMGSTISRNQSDLIKRLANPIILFLDNDEAGIEGTLKIARALSRANPEVRVAKYPDWAGSDFQPDHFNAKGISAALDGAMRWRTWATRTLRKDTDELSVVS